MSGDSEEALADRPRPAGVALDERARTSSRNRPFHSTQRSPANDPTWYRPAASQASAMSFVSARIGSVSMSQMIGGRGTGSPSSSRDRTDARSNRKPSTCISATQ